jgi:hypothetical protein
MDTVEVGGEEVDYIDVPSALSDWYSEDAAGPADLVGVVGFFAEEGADGLERCNALEDAVVVVIVLVVVVVVVRFFC